MTKDCFGCGVLLTRENDSEAHVIPQALGGRLGPKGILCGSCNGVLNIVADLPLVQSFDALPTLLNIPRDRGSNPTKTLSTREGHKVSLDADGKLTRVDVTREVTDIPEGKLVELGAGNMRTAKQLLKWAEKEFPGFDHKEAEKHLQVVAMPEGDELRLRFDFSHEKVFGGIIAAVWIYLIHKTGTAFMPFNRLLKSIHGVQQHGGMFRYLVDGLPGLRGPAIDLGHKIVVRVVPSTGELIAFVEVLGVLKIGGIVARGPLGQSLEHIYVYDIAAKADRSGEFSIDADTFDVQQWASAGLGAEDATLLRQHFANVLHALTDVYYRKATSVAEQTQG